MYINNEGPFETITLETVTTATVKEIEKRALSAMVPAHLQALAASPNLVRKLTYRIMLKDDTIAEVHRKLASSGN